MSTIRKCQPRFSGPRSNRRPNETISSRSVAHLLARGRMVESMVVRSDRTRSPHGNEKFPEYGVSLRINGESIVQMQIEESGTVIEVRGQTALVRLRRSSACSGCAAAGQCHAGRGESEQLLEARNEAGAAAGDAVRVAVPASAVINASARIYLLPVVGLLIGAGVAQVLAGTFISAPAGANAAGFGGIAGAILGVLLARRLARRALAGTAPLPRISRVVAAVDSLSDRG